MHYLKKYLAILLALIFNFGLSGFVFGQNSSQIANNSNSKPANNFLLKRSDTVILLVDHQVGLLSGVRDIGTGELSNNVAALAKAAKILGVPVIVTTVGPGDMWGPLIPELAKEVSGINIIKRTAVNAWDDPKVVQAIKARGRKQILVAGISLEVCAAFPALSAKEQGFDSRVVLDASGTFNEAKRQSGIQRLTVSGIPLTDYAAASVELLGDNADPKAGEVYGAMNMSFANIVWQLNNSAKASARAQR